MLYDQVQSTCPVSWRGRRLGLVGSKDQQEDCADRECSWLAPAPR